MSIATKTGDSGTTGLMYNRRVPKSHPRIEACGDVDELNSAIGLARSLTSVSMIQASLLPIQKDLIVIMGQLATRGEDMDRYLKDGFAPVTPALTGKLDRLVEEIERQKVSCQGWATPGATPAAAALDVARGVCRRAERRVCLLQESGEMTNAEILIYLNRLSDALWLLARWLEAREGPATKD